MSQKWMFNIVRETLNKATCTGGDVPCAHRPMAIASRTEVTGQLPLFLLESAGWTLDTAFLLTVVVRAWQTSD